MENIKGATAELQIVHHFKLSTSIPTFESNFSILIIFLCMALPAGNPWAFLSSPETRQPGHTFIGFFVTRIRKSKETKERGGNRKSGESSSESSKKLPWREEPLLSRRSPTSGEKLVVPDRTLNRWVEDYNRHIKGYLGFAEKCPEIIFDWRNFALNPEKNINFNDLYLTFAILFFGRALIGNECG